MKRKIDKKKPVTSGNDAGDVSKIIHTASQLLEEGNTGMAMVYFWSAGEKYEKAREYKLAARAYEKAGYCYELEGRWEKAAEDYFSASKMYDLAGNSGEAAKMRNIANQNREKMKVK